MKILDRVKSELIASIDIETVRISKKFEDLSEGYQSAWEYKNKQDGKVPSKEGLADLWERTASLYAEFSKICAISLTYLNQQGNLVCKEFYGENEKALLQALDVTLTNMVSYNPEYRLMGHASKYFDFPFTGKRYIINGLDIPKVLDSTACKPWEQTNLCTNELWKLGGTGAGSSLQALCNVLDVPISKVDLVGDEVGGAYYKREFQRIGRYCSLDTIACFNVVRKFKKESIFQFEDVQYIVAYSEDSTDSIEKIEEQPILKELYITKQFNDKVKNYLKNKKITKKDKPTVQKLVLASYKEEIPLMGANKKELQEINKQRTEEVSSFFKTL